MPVYPKAVKKLIDPGSNDPRITPRVAILHVDAGNAHSLYDYFSTRSGGVESHFHIQLDGTVEQYRDTDYQADANYLANDFAISIETQGFGNGEWTRAQLDSIKELLTWLNKTHGIPLQVASEWDGSGVGYHIQFGSPGKWTNVAKSCPGPERIAQFKGELTDFLTTPQRRRPRFTRGKRVDEALAAVRAAIENAGQGKRGDRLRIARKFLLRINRRRR